MNGIIMIGFITILENTTGSLMLKKPNGKAILNNTLSAGSFEKILIANNNANVEPAPPMNSMSNAGCV